jgi:hypothetical protein
MIFGTACLNTAPGHTIQHIMTEEQLKQLRAYYHFLLGQQRVWDDAAQRGVVDGAEVRMLEDELRRIESDFPGLIPHFDRNSVFSHRGADEPLYAVGPIRSFVAGAVARLKVSIDVTEGQPVTQHREFSFINDTGVRTILDRDYSEIQRAYIAKCWKSVIILSGGAIEAVLVDQLLQNPGAARAATKAPREPDISKWDLANLIAVAVELGIVSSGAEKLSHSVREYRNLVHPGNEIRRNSHLMLRRRRSHLRCSIYCIVISRRDPCEPVVGCAQNALRISRPK